MCGCGRERGCGCVSVSAGGDVGVGVGVGWHFGGQRLRHTHWCVGVGRDGDVRLCKVPEIFCSL